MAVLDIIPAYITYLFIGKIINLHPAYLPYNRGLYTNFFAALEGTPSGVTIHNLVKGLDEGDILVQKELQFKGYATLEQSYNVLQIELQELFKQNWDKIKYGKIKPQKQKGKGTCHTKKDFDKTFYKLTINQVKQLWSK